MFEFGEFFMLEPPLNGSACLSLVYKTCCDGAVLPYASFQRGAEGDIQGQRNKGPLEKSRHVFATVCIRVEAIASRLEAIDLRLEATATRLGTIASRLEVLLSPRSKLSPEGHGQEENFTSDHLP